MHSAAEFGALASANARKQIAAVDAAAGAGVYGARQRQALADRTGAAIRGAARRRERERRRGGRRARLGAAGSTGCRRPASSSSAAWAPPTSAATAAPSSERRSTRASSRPRSGCARRSGGCSARSGRAPHPVTASLSGATDTSRDGRVVVGHAWDGCNITHAFRWEESTAWSTSGVLSRDAPVSRWACRQTAGSWSATRTHATGFSQGARWVDGRQELFPGPDGFVGTAKAANSDGSIVVGRVCSPAASQPGDPNFQSAWVWTQQDGTRCLPAPRLRVSPGPLIIVEANATSDDGRVIGGGQNVGGSDGFRRRHLDRPRSRSI